MVKVGKFEDYTKVATFFESERIEVAVFYKGESKVENMYIVNIFPYTEENLPVFKKLFNFWHSKDKPQEFVDFFVHKENFYVIFNYIKAESIAMKFGKEVNTTTFDERCEILEDILVKIDSLSKLPMQVLCSILDLENILVDSGRHVRFAYDLRKIFENEASDVNTMFEQIHDIIFTMLQKEAEAKYNRSLHLILNKLKMGIYSSAPKLAVDLRRAEKISKATSWFTFLRSIYDLHKPAIDKTIKVSISCAIVAGLVFLGYRYITQGEEAQSAPRQVSIGGVNYNGNTQDESAKDVADEAENDLTNPAVPANMTLTPGLDMAYEDYVIQYGDTFDSICKNYYKDISYVTAVATFNGLLTTDQLVAGSIIKLPNKTAIALYLAK